MVALYILTGSNGAGKSSIGRALLPAAVQHLIPFDGDAVFLQKKKELRKAGIRVDKEVADIASQYTDKMFEQAYEMAFKNGADFAYEGHFSEDNSWELPKKFKENGYQLHLIFLGLLDLELSQSRVKERAFTGGHDVDPLTISMNYYGNLEKVNEYFRLFDSLQILDTSELPRSLAFLQNGVVTESVHYTSLPLWFSEFLPAIKKLIVEWE